MATTTWDLVGNTGNASGSFLGTTDAQSLVVKTSGAERLRIDTSGKVGVGTTTPSATLDVLSTTTDVALAGSSQHGIAVRAAAQQDTALFATSDSGMGVDARSNSNIGVQALSQTNTGLYATSDSGTAVDARSNSSIGVRALSQSNTGLFATSDSGMGVDARSNSNIGIQALSQTNTGLFATSNSGMGVDARSSSSVGVRAQSQTNTGVFATSDSGMGVDARSTSNIGIQALSQTNTGLFATSNSGMGVDARSNSNIGVQAVSQTNTGLFATSNSGRGVDARSSSGVGLFAAGGQFAAFFEGDITVTGDILLPGADCAEHFDTVSGDRPPDAGTVVVIDEGGLLRESHEAYDRKVAGVVSGAGEYRTAIVLDKRLSDKNRVPVASVGKVYCKVDAQYGAIEVGDLLTSSQTPGHAMKASDVNQAFGSILGKALRPLAGGTGIIPVLVTLQ